jgi:3-oxoacyl-[acyl-carrier protein] reductase
LVARVAAVTGAACGVGAAVAVGLAAAGLDIAALDEDEAGCGPTVAAVGRLGRRAVATGTGGGMEAALARIAQRLGEPTVLVNAAGPDGGPPPLSDRALPDRALPDRALTDRALRDRALTDWALTDWAARVETVLYRAFAASRAASEYMMRQWWGRIVNVAVGTAPTTTEALLGLTRTLALECEPFGIAVNAVATQAPAVPVELSSTRGPAPAPDGDPFAAAVRAVSMLAGPDASGLSGQVLYVACGR